MKKQKHNIIFIYLAAAAALIFWIFQNINKNKEDFVVEDVVSARSLLTDNYAAYASKLIAFVPGAGGTYYSPDKSIVFYPQPSPTWLATFTNSLKQLTLDAINTYYNTPNTLFMFDGAGFMGRLIAIPFDPIPKDQKLKFSINSQHAILFVQLLEAITPGKIFSCIVCKGYKVTILFEGAQDPLSLPPGGHQALTCPTTIRTIDIEPETKN